MSVRRSAPGATPVGSGEPTSVTSISGHGRGLRWQNTRKSYACSFGSTARLAWTKFWPSPAVIPASLPFLMSRRISRGWRVSIGIGGFYLSSGRRRSLTAWAALPPAETRPHVGIHEHVGPLAAQDAEHLARDLHRRLARGLAGGPGDMRRAHLVLEVQERVVRGRGLVVPDVEPGGAELATGQRLEERALVLDGAARGVDVDRARLHEADRLLVDHVPRLGRERRVARQHVDLGQQRLETRHRLGATTPQLVVRHVLVVAEHAHPERARELRDTPTDVADADDAQGLAAELGVARTDRVPVACARGLVDRERALDAGEHQHQRVLGDRLRVGAGRVDDRDAEPGRGGNVDRVQSHAVPAHHLERAAGRHQALGAVGPDAKQDPLRVGRRLDQAGTGLVVADDDARFLLEQRLAVVMNGTGEHDEWTLSGHRGISLLAESMGAGFYYFQATATSRWASSEKGVPSRPPKSSTLRQRSGLSMCKSSWAE